MKTHELARNLESLAKLLRRLPDVDLDAARSYDLQDLFPHVGGEMRRGAAKPRKDLPVGIENYLASISPAEIEKYLMSDVAGLTATDLLEISQRLGLKTSKRQSRSALVNMLVRHYEATKMHSIMRGSKQVDVSDSAIASEAASANIEAHHQPSSE